MAVVAFFRQVEQRTNLEPPPSFPGGDSHVRVGASEEARAGERGAAIAQHSGGPPQA